MYIFIIFLVPEILKICLVTASTKSLLILIKPTFLKAAGDLELDFYWSPLVQSQKSFRQPLVPMLESPKAAGVIFRRFFRKVSNGFQEPVNIDTIGFWKFYCDCVSGF